MSTAWTGSNLLSGCPFNEVLLVTQSTDPWSTVKPRSLCGSHGCCGRIRPRRNHHHQCKRPAGKTPRAVVVTVGNQASRPAADAVAELDVVGLVYVAVIVEVEHGIWT